MTTDLSIPLREIAGAVKQKFLTAPMDDDGDVLKAQWNDLTDRDGTTARGTPRVNFFPGFRMLGGRLYVAGKQRCIAVSPAKDGAQLARYMDMAALHFWKYRQRNIRPVTDADLIFSVAQAKADTENYPYLVELLRETEELFLAHKLFPPPRQEGDKPDDTRTIRHAVNNMTDLLRKDLAEHSRAIEALTRQVGEMAKRLPGPVNCPKCGNYMPGHATGAGDICSCESV